MTRAVGRAGDASTRAQNLLSDHERDWSVKGSARFWRTKSRAEKRRPSGETLPADMNDANAPSRPTRSHTSPSTPQQRARRPRDNGLPFGDDAPEEQGVASPSQVLLCTSRIIRQVVHTACTSEPPSEKKVVRHLAPSFRQRQQTGKKSCESRALSLCL